VNDQIIKNKLKAASSQKIQIVKSKLIIGMNLEKNVTNKCGKKN
jgi:hypothetical protein